MTVKQLCLTTDVHANTLHLLAYSCFIRVPPSHLNNPCAWANAPQCNQTQFKTEISKFYSAMTTEAHTSRSFGLRMQILPTARLQKSVDVCCLLGIVHLGKLSTDVQKWETCFMWLLEAAAFKLSYCRTDSVTSKLNYKINASSVTLHLL